jgi:hypothetical protein
MSEDDMTLRPVEVRCGDDLKWAPGRIVNGRGTPLVGHTPTSHREVAAQLCDKLNSADEKNNKQL